MNKRDLFSELTEGFAALEAQRTGKLTLRQHRAEYKVTPVADATDVLTIRTKLNVSRAVFAQYLRTNPRTIENWEQGRAKPNAQAVLLMRLVDKYPDTLEKLAMV
jgi:putative transcriptional regulator